MKDDLMGDLEKDQGGLSGLRNVSVHLGSETWGSRGLWPPPRWRGASRDLVETFFQRAAIHIVSAGLPVWTLLGPSEFH